MLNPFGGKKGDRKKKGKQSKSHKNGSATKKAVAVESEDENDKADKRRNGGGALIRIEALNN